MSTLFVDTPPLIAVTVIFSLSLGGAYVLFQTLKATAVMKTVRGQAGGALAGFLMVFSALGGTYLKLLPAAEDLDALRAENARLEARLQELERATGSEFWTLVGDVRRGDAPSATGVEVLVMPPNPRLLVEGHGNFRFESLKVVNGIWPELHVSADGYYPETLILAEEHLELHPERKLAVLKQPVVLADAPEPHGLVAASLGRSEPAAVRASGS
ncbi:MAG TPA: hypothetical protein VLF66_15785 [Thermoanaerobaculia bacterium]|nr:hypothetical protein [Thermoanaerobaculia bacterium]